MVIVLIKMLLAQKMLSSMFCSGNHGDDTAPAGGRNGFGAKLCNIFSTKFTVETACRESKQSFKQVRTRTGTGFGPGVAQNSSESTSERGGLVQAPQVLFT